MSDRAIRLTVRDPDDLQRSRLTVGFRLLLAFPHFFWAAGWFSVAATLSIANWIATLIAGTSPRMFHDFLSAYIRYVTHLVAYLTLAANPYPDFTGRPGYPIDVEVDPPAEQNRWVTGFRLFLALPAILLADTLLGFGTSFAGGSVGSSGGVAATVAFLAWFACVFTARMPRGFRDLLAYCIGYSAQVIGYLLLLTDRYPNSDPAVYEAANVYRSDPIRLHVTDDLQRSRLTVFFRLPLVFPHFVWLLLWGIAAFFAAIANWFVTLFRGRPAAPLHRFISGLVRYQTHVYAFLQLVANPFPGFSGRPGTYPVEVEIDPPERQNRWKTAFRLILAFPAFMVAGALSTRCLRGRDAELVLCPRPRACAPRPAESGRVRAAVRGTGVRLRLSAHRPVPVQRSVRRLADGADPGAASAGRDATGDLTRVLKWLVPAALVVAAWIVAVPLLWPTDVPDDLSTAGSRSGRVLRAGRARGGARLRALHADQRRAVDRGAARRAGRLCTSWRAVHARVGGGADRHRHAARDARVRVRVAGPAAVRRRPAVVGPPPRRLRAGVRGLGAVELLLARRGIRVRERRRPDRDGPGETAAAAVVDSRGRRFAGLGLLFTFAGPFLIPDQSPLRNDRLAAQAKQLAREQGVSDIKVRVEDVDAFTNEPNAFAIGLGPTRRVILWNTLLEPPFSDREVRVVIAHELAHHSRDHLWKLSGWYALVALPVAWMIAIATRRRGGMFEPRAVPLALLVAVVLQTAVTPAQNVVSSRYEAEADWVALQTTRDPGPAAKLEEKLAETTHTDPEPPGMDQRPVRHPSDDHGPHRDGGGLAGAPRPPTPLGCAHSLSQPTREVTWKPPRRHQRHRRQARRPSRPAATIRCASMSNTRRACRAGRSS